MRNTSNKNEEFESAWVSNRVGVGLKWVTEISPDQAIRHHTTCKSTRREPSPLVIHLQAQRITLNKELSQYQ